MDMDEVDDALINATNIAMDAVTAEHCVAEVLRAH